MNVSRDISRMLVPLPDDHTFFRRHFSWTVLHSSEVGDYKVLPSTVAMHRQRQDSLTATTSLGNMSMHSPSPSQAPGLHTYSAVRLPNSTSNDYGPFDPYSTHDKAAPSNFQSECQGRQLPTPVASTEPQTGVSARRNSTYWCRSCDTGFSQRQALNRHDKDKHSQWNPCPYCSDSRWSPGRRYLFKIHLETKHPGAALPRT